MLASQLDRLPQIESDWNLTAAMPLPEALDRLTDHLAATLRARYPEAYPAHEAAAERFAQELKDARGDIRPDDLYTDEAREAAVREYGERLDRAEKWLGDTIQMIDALDDPEWTNNRDEGD